MKRKEIHASKELTITEKNIFLWLTDYSHRHKIIDLRHVDIAKATLMNKFTIIKNISSLEKKGFIKITKHYSSYKCNSYQVLR